MSRPAVSPFASTRPGPPLVPPVVPPPVCVVSNRVVVPPPIFACRAIAPPELPPRSEELNSFTSQPLSYGSYSLIALVIVLYGAAAIVMWDSTNGDSAPNKIGVVAENETPKPLNENLPASGLTLAVHHEAFVAAIDPVVLWPTDAALDELARTVDHEFDALPPEDVRVDSPADKVTNIAELIEFSQPPDDLSTSDVASESESAAESIVACKDGTCPTPSAKKIAVNSKSANAACADGTRAVPRTLGTLIDWAPTAERAGEIASKESKLVFLMQVSGNFARQEFT